MTSGASSAEPPSPFGDGDVVLADSSAWLRADRLPESLRSEWVDAVAGNRIATSPVIKFELLYAAARRGRDQFQAWLASLEGLGRNLIPDRNDWTVASAAYVELEGRGQLAGVSMTDILVAATASRTSIPVLHVDKDYQRLQALPCMNFDARRLLPPGFDV